MTWREVQWLADGREQVEWNRAGVMMANARLAFDNKEGITVAQLIPERYRKARTERKKTPEQIEDENRLGWLAIDHFITKGNPGLSVKQSG